MSRYETHKPSGIDWIGEVPEHWNFERMKYAFRYEKGVNAALYTQEFIADNPGPYPVYSGQTEEEGIMGEIKTFDYDFSEVLFTTTVGAKAMTLLSLCGKFSLSQNCAIIYPKKKEIQLRYYYYFLQSQFDYEKGKISLIMQPSLRFQDLDTYKVIKPTVDEQLTIANYLDDQTLKIDRLIANKKAQAEKLKELRQIEINNAVTKGLNPNIEMKDSGIEWLGKIPKHWEVKRLKNLANQMSEKSSEILDDDFLVALENIESHTGKFIETSSEYENNGIRFKKDNLLYNKLRPYLNKVFLAYKDGICVGDIIVVECTPNLHPAFLQFRMLSDSFCSIIMSSVYGAKMPRTSWQFISGLKIGYPSFEEQVQIVEYLNKRTIAIEGLIQNINRQIEKLQELRKIKIYEAVTGKIKVNAYAENTA